jgi:hypothetical protein
MSASYWSSATSSIDNSSNYNLPGLRHSHSLQGRDWNSRHVSDAAHTPLSVYHGSGTPTSQTSERHLSFPTSNTGSTTTSSFGGYEPHVYSSQSGLHTF